jgi:tRNA pseudouridine38-40 synthase
MKIIDRTRAALAAFRGKGFDTSQDAALDHLLEFLGVENNHNRKAMAEAAGYFVGRHDFAPFAANPHRELESTVRNVFSFTVKKNGPRYVFAVRGDGFLYKQVRSMVGFLISVGKGNEKPEAVKEILEANAPRTARVETAPSRGLFLWKVFY